MRNWFSGVAVISLIFNLSAVFSPIAAAETPAHEAVLLIAEDALIPAGIYVPEGEDLLLHVLNIRKLAGKFSVPGVSESVALKPNQVQTFTIPAAAITQEAQCQFTCKQSAFEGTAALVAGLPEAGKKLDIPLIAQRKQFLPEVVTVPAGQPLTLALYSLVGLPHADFELLGANVKLPFKTRKLVAIDVKEGLAAGTYLVSRPKFPQQKHNIKTRFEAVEMTEVDE